MAGIIKSNMAGTVLRVLVKPGDSVKADQDVVAIESMKMEMTVPSTLSGTVQEVLVSVEDFVQEGQDLIKLG
jgi:acetyl-CoA carboxylase biotin carboxyl carrier protein